MPALQPIDDLSAAVRDELTAPWAGMRDLDLLPNFENPRTRRDFHVLQCVQSPAQARIRMAYFLSQVCVASDRHPDLHGQTRITERYWETLMRRAFDPYKNVLLDVTFSAAQLFYLTLLDSRKADGNGVAPDENYAREVMQLFTTGKDEIDADGRLTGKDVYSREDVSEAARVLTGMVMPVYTEDGELIHDRDTPYFVGLRLNPRQAPKMADGEPTYVYHETHDFGEVVILGRTIPSDEAAYAQLLTDGADDEADTNPDTPDENIRAAMALARSRVEQLIDILVEHPNTPRNLARQMIGHHVTRSYSPAYFQRVVQAAEDGTYTLPDGSVVGTGQRLDLAAMYAAVRLDPEAREPATAKDRLWGRHRPAFLAYCSAIRPLLASSAVTPVAAVPHMRGLAGPGTGFRWDVRNRSMPLTAPSVFNFFESTFTVPDEEFQSAEVPTPELQIVDTLSVVDFAYQIADVANCMKPDAIQNVWLGRESSELTDVWALDLGRFLRVADDPAALTALLDLEFTANTLEDGNLDLVREVIEGVEASPGGITDGERFGRFRAGWIAVCCCPEFHTQR